MKPLKRAFTKDGGSLVQIRNEQGEIDLNAIYASIIRAIILILLLYLANILGVEIPVI